MRGLVFTGNRNAELREFPDPQAGPGEAVVAIRASGLCGSDFKRYRPDTVLRGDVIIGHEPCGVIAELGPGAPPGLAVGDRVMVHHYTGCGVCEVCAMGFEQACPTGHVTYGTNAHGSHADLMLVASRTLVPLPDALSFEEGAAISCGTGTAWNGLKRMSVAGGDTVAVFGQGPVGLSGTISAKAMGARVIAVDIVPERLALAHSLGADHVIDGSEVDPVEAIRELTGGAGATVTLETSGNPVARSQVLQALRLFGRCCYVGTGAAAPANIDIDFDLIRKAAIVYGGWTFTKSELAQIARFMVEGAVALGDMITHRFRLDDAVEAYRVFDSATTGKCVLVMD
jgi:threonine dehydrogenase-like Zn-dependent dehydrogenase